MTTQQVAVICNSVNAQGHKLTSFKLRYHKFIHGEFMTHRALSRNASSSRAIPVAKLIAEVRDDATRAAPVWWGREQKGMQSGDELSKANPEHDLDSAWDDGIGRCKRIGCGFQTDVKGWWPCTSDRESAEILWRRAAVEAANGAEQMVKIGVHKSIVNRILEPYSHINVVASGTDAGWMNFFGLRLDKAAQPEMRALAELMWRAYGESAPKLLQPGEWHLPFIEEEERLVTWDDVCPCSRMVSASGRHTCGCYYNVERLTKVSVARCARVSYESFETGRRSTVAEDLALYERLVGAQPLHASPAEHQATPSEWVPEKYSLATVQQNEQEKKQRAIHLSLDEYGYWKNAEQWGNFTGWRQYRKMLPGEAIAPLPKEYR